MFNYLMRMKQIKGYKERFRNINTIDIIPMCVYDKNKDKIDSLILKSNLKKIKRKKKINR